MQSIKVLIILFNNLYNYVYPITYIIIINY